MAGPDAAMFTVNNLWILISAALVFIMHLGFASVESGMCQQKNTRQHPVQERVHRLHRRARLHGLGLQRDVSG